MSPKDFLAYSTSGASLAINEEDSLKKITDLAEEYQVIFIVFERDLGLDQSGSFFVIALNLFCVLHFCIIAFLKNLFAIMPNFDVL